MCKNLGVLTCHWIKTGARQDIEYKRNDELSSMGTTDKDRPTRYRPVVLVSLACFLLLNVYFDYHHPAWVVIDGVALLGVASMWLVKVEGSWF